MLGRFLVSKSNGVLFIIYSLTMDDAEVNAIEEIQREINRYILTYKHPKVKHSIIISEDIGLKALGVESQPKAFRIQWITRINTSHD